MLMANTPSNAEKDWDGVSGDEPMTGAEASYPQTFCEQAHVSPPDKKLTVAEASKLIDEMRTKAGFA
jgi:hypothetical protein